MKTKIYKIKDTVDVFLSEIPNDEKLFITFHVMTTRQRIEIKASRDVASFISHIDGKNTLEEIKEHLGGVNESEFNKIISFLLVHHLIFDVEYIQIENTRYSRQITFWDDFVLDRTGIESQNILERKKVTLFGCGAVGAKIIEILVRSGVKNITLIDYKNLRPSDRARHGYFNEEYVGKAKVDALYSFLKEIDSELKVTVHNEKLNPNSEISKWIDDDCDLIINTCDEPYIGHTSLKIGRYAHTHNIPIYVAGGFDAHLMSAGELVYPPKTPCIDCIQQTFSKSLSGWRPIYSNTDVKMEDRDDNSQQHESLYNDFILGGPGGLGIMSGFSANLSAMCILQFLVEDSALVYKNTRDEFLPNSGTMTSFSFNKQKGCKVCDE